MGSILGRTSLLTPAGAFAICSEMPWPIRRHTLEIIYLKRGRQAPLNAHWINVGPVRGGCCYLVGNIPLPGGVVFEYGEYPSIGDALKAAFDFARMQGCKLLYIETDARRCARW